MRVYQIMPSRPDDSPGCWISIERAATQDLLNSLPFFDRGESLAMSPCAPPDADVAEQIRIILFAREMGWL